MWFPGIRNGTIPEWRLNEMIRQILTPYYYSSQDHEYPTIDPSSYAVTAATYGILPAGEVTPAGRDVRGNHSLLIRKIGSAGTVLLKIRTKHFQFGQPWSLESSVTMPQTSMEVFFPNNNYGPKIGTLVVSGGSGSAVPPHCFASRGHKSTRKG